MKKKIIISLVVILIIGAIVAGYILTKKEKVEKFTDIKILDYYGKEIENYKENKKSFTIQKQNSEQKIKVNGKEYQENERFYETGNYKIELVQNSKKQVAIVNIKDIEEDKKQEYNIYITTSTLPTFMAMLDIASKDEVQGFLWTQKPTSLDLESIKNNTKNLVISEYAGNTKEADFKDKIIPEVKKYVQEVIEKDENAYFNLYVDDYRFYLDVELFGKIGLGDNRYTYYLYSDGTSSYVTDFKIGDTYSHKEYEIRKENAYDKFKSEKQNYNELVSKMRSNQYEYNDMPGSYMVKEDGDTYNYDYMLLATLRNNVKYLLQYPQMIDFKDEKVAKEMKNAHIEKIDLKSQYQNLSAEKKSEFLASIKLDKATLDKDHFVDENARYLVVTGAKPYYGDLDQTKFEEIMKKVTEKYGKEYTILYKPHPSALPDETQQKFLDSLSIKVLPGRIPMEAIMFVYPNLKLGGFASSLYMSAEENQTEFFFASKKEDLVSPLNELYDKLFSNAEFYN